MAHSIDDVKDSENNQPLKRGWTTGACATAATKAALSALLTDRFEDPVTILLPKGETPSFPLAIEEKAEDFARAGIIKDAGDDPDVTHGAMIVSKVQFGENGTGITFKAGKGVGTVTRPGLPLDVGEPAINPVPRSLMSEVVETLCATHGAAPDIEIEISIPTGEQLADQTWNPRLGIVGGLSILGTTGIVHPFSCSAWIHSIHRGIDVAVAEGLPHVAGCTGSTSEKAVQEHFGLPDHAMLDMGDFAGGMLKYIRNHPVPRVTIGGGFAKLTKLGQGFMDLHSGRSQVDFEWLADRAVEAGIADAADAIRSANTAAHAREIGLEHGMDLAPTIARHAQEQARKTLRNLSTLVDIMVIDRKGNIIAQQNDPKTGEA
ncbi:MAG: cobalt-precorrin-5B (C(1))-methyltransferase [Hyphomicrobiales bacterium]